ncbi:hypothetical protein [Methylorubrum extorquens]
MLRRIAFDCPWLDERHPRAKSQYVPKCKAHFPTSKLPALSLPTGRLD